MNQFNYTPNLSGLTIIKTKDEQFDKFFYQGHPKFLIPDFNGKSSGQGPVDMWLLYLDYLEDNFDCPVYDQDGGEVTSIQIIDPNTGLTKCVWEAWGISFSEDDEPQDFQVEVEGYVAEDKGEVYFLATKVFENSKV